MGKYQIGITLPNRPLAYVQIHSGASQFSRVSSVVILDCGQSLHDPKNLAAFASKYLPNDKKACLDRYGERDGNFAPEKTMSARGNCEQRSHGRIPSIGAESEEARRTSPRARTTPVAREESIPITTRSTKMD